MCILLLLLLLQVDEHTMTAYTALAQHCKVICEQIHTGWQAALNTLHNDTAL